MSGRTLAWFIVFLLYFIGCAAKTPTPPPLEDPLPPDAGFLKQGKMDMLWARPSLPVQVLIAPEALHRYGELRDGVLLVNFVCQCELFKEPVPVGEGYVQAWYSDGHGFKDTVMFRADSATTRGYFEPTFNGPYFHAMVLTLPEEIEDQFVSVAIIHELLHGVGLAHDGDPRSIMYPYAWSHDQVVLRGDAARLQRVYGGRQ